MIYGFDSFMWIIYTEQSPPPALQKYDAIIWTSPTCSYKLVIYCLSSVNRDGIINTIVYNVPVYIFKIQIYNFVS